MVDGRAVVRMARRYLWTTWLLAPLALACNGSPQSTPTSPPVAVSVATTDTSSPTPTATAAEVPLGKGGATCTQGDTCASGVCQGEGCGAEDGRCMSPDVHCLRDRVPFCGCDGVTFHASSNCPQRTFRHRGDCQKTEPDGGSSDK